MFTRIICFQNQFSNIIGAKAIIKVLQDICTLIKIHFANNNISDEMANDIATIVSNNTKLKVIEISGSKLRTSGTISIMEAMQKNCTLKGLYLNNNKITEDAADHIANAVSFCVLQELNLGSNNLQTSGIIIIARTLQNISSLTKLYIHNNSITDEAADDIAAAISCNIHLQELNLGGNNLQLSGIIIIARTLQNMCSSLTKLYIHNNSITCEAADDIAAAISFNMN